MTKGDKGTPGDPLDLETLDRICHEARRPLGVIQAHVELLEDEIPGPLTAEQRASLSVIAGQVQLLSRQVGEAYTTFEALAGKTRVTPEYGDLARLLEGLLEELEARFPVRPGRLVREIAPALGRFDPALVASALRAVLENAFQFGAKAGDILVRLVPTEEGAQVTVLDHGPGIAADERELVFESFYRGRLGNAVCAKGLGLGLTRCRALMRAMGGAVGWLACPEGGTGVVLDIPLHAQRDARDGSGGGRELRQKKGGNHELATGSKMDR